MLFNHCQTLHLLSYYDSYDTPISVCHHELDVSEHNDAMRKNLYTHVVLTCMVNYEYDTPSVNKRSLQ